MVKIDSKSLIDSLMPRASISKIILEQNVGFIKEISNPHIESPLEREREETQDPLSINFRVSCLQKKSSTGLFNKGIGKILKDNIKIAVVFVENVSDIIDIK